MAKSLTPQGWWSLAVRERDNNVCQRCGDTDSPKLAHHLIRGQDAPSRFFDLTNGQTLCRPCHYAVHREMRDADPSMGYFTAGGLRQYRRHRDNPIPQDQLH